MAAVEAKNVDLTVILTVGAGHDYAIAVLTAVAVNGLYFAIVVGKMTEVVGNDPDCVNVGGNLAVGMSGRGYGIVGDGGNSPDYRIVCGAVDAALFHPLGLLPHCLDCHFCNF